MTGTPRDWRAVGDGADDGFLPTPTTFGPHPGPAQVYEPPFLIDERPDPSVRGWTSRGLTPPPRPVAVRLTDLVVHHNRALRGARVRVDTLVLTGGGDELPVHRAETAWFPRILDGDRLPLDNLLVYHGPAVDYLDIAWWVSRDRRNTRALSELLRERLTDGTVSQAVQSLSAIAVGSPTAALAAGAVGACAILVSTAYELLSAAVDDTIGLYRTSWLAREGFGVGRHPVQGTRTIQDFSFAYEILTGG